MSALCVHHVHTVSTPGTISSANGLPLEALEALKNGVPWRSPEYAEEVFKLLRWVYWMHTETLRVQMAQTNCS